MSKKAVPVFWYVGIKSKKAEGFAKALEVHGYRSHYFYSIAELRRKITKLRSRLLILTAGNEDLNTFRNLVLDLGTIPELNGAYFILLGESLDRDKKAIAVANNFRDLIDANISSEAFVHRVLVATCRKKHSVVWQGMQLRLQKKSLAHIPSRLTWLDEEKLRIEAPFIIPKGGTLWIKGEIFKKFGLEPLRLIVKEHSRQNLSYRFSHAFIAEWAHSEESTRQKNKIIRFAKDHDSNKQTKVFLAVQNPSLRNSLTGLFKKYGCDVRAALSKNSIVREPLFLSPDIFILEDKLLSDPKLKGQLTDKFNNPPDIAKVWLIQGNQIPLKNFVEKMSTKLEVKLFDQKEENFLKSIEKSIPAKTIDYKRVYLGLGHQLSIVDVLMPATVESIFPAGGVIGFPGYMRPNSLIRIEWQEANSPESKSYFLKVLGKNQDSAPNAKFRYYSQFAFVDLSDSAHKRFLEHLWRSLGTQWQIDVEKEVKQSNKKISSSNKKIKKAQLPTLHSDSRPQGQPSSAVKPSFPGLASPVIKDTGMAIGFVGGLASAFAGIYLAVGFFAPEGKTSGKMFSRELEKRYETNEPVERVGRAEYPPSFESRFKPQLEEDFRFAPAPQESGDAPNTTDETTLSPSSSLRESKKARDTKKVEPVNANTNTESLPLAPEQGGNPPFEG